MKNRLKFFWKLYTHYPGYRGIIIEQQMSINWIEKQELNHIKDMQKLKLSFTDEIENLMEVISNMSQTHNKFKEQEQIKYKSLLDSVLEKDVKIQELEEQNELLEIKNLQLSHHQLSEFQISDITEISTQNNALKLNLKNQTTKVWELEEINNELTLKGNLKKNYLRNLWMK